MKISKLFKGVLLCLFSVFFGLSNSFAQTGKISGIVKDENGKILFGATILVMENEIGTTANDLGHYTLSLKPGTYHLKISFAGMASIVRKIVVVENSSLQENFSLVTASNLENVIVTGTRNKQGRTNILSPVPVDVVNIASLSKEVAQLDLNQILSYVAPSFQSSRQTISDGTDHIDPAQLRGLGSDQVLVLVNGKRRHQSGLVNVNGTINRGQVGTDLSALPTTAIEKVEVLRDGAAAQYGSDAIAGVINVVMKKSVGVLSGNVSYGANITAYEKDYAIHNITKTNIGDKKQISDGGSLQAGLNYGIGIGEKGFLNLSGEFTMRQPSNRTGTFSGQVYPSVNSANRDDSILGVRNLTRNAFDMRIGNSKMVGGAIFANGEYNISNHWKLSVFGGYNSKNGESAGFYRYPVSIAGNGGAYVAKILGKYSNGFLPLIKSEVQDISVSAGINGQLGAWDMSLSNTFGQNTFEYDIENSINYTQFAVTGNPQSTFDAGSISFLQNTVNLDFSRNFNALAGLNLAFGAEYRLDQYGQKAGEEASYKNFNTDSKAAPGAQVFSGFLPSNDGKQNRTSQALYADAEFDFTKKFLVGVALRFENFSDFGSTLNYKATSRYKVAEWLVMRGSISTGFRAPSMQQRFYSKTNTVFVTGPNGDQIPVEAGTFTNESKPAEILGIPKLKEETSENYGIGFALKPIKNLEISLDGYYIKVKDRIILSNNFSGGTNQALKDQLAAAGASTANFFTNAVNTTAKGLEAVVAYSKNFGDHKFKFTFSSNFIENSVEKGLDGKPIIKASNKLLNSGQLKSYFNREDQSRFENAAPKYKLSFMLNYKIHKFSAMARATSFGSVTYLDGLNGFTPNLAKNDFTGNVESTDQVFAGKTVFDVSGSYEISKHFTVTAGANNLLDEYQDKQAHSLNVGGGRFIFSRRVNQMGVNGRYLFTRIAFNF